MKILLVDDSRFLRKAGEQALRKAGYDVISASDGDEALKIAQEQIPNLILLDMMLPKLPGLEVLRALKQNAATKDIPVIIYSTSSQKSDLLQARTSGALCFVTKPANYGRLKKILEIVISYMEKDTLSGVCDAVHAYLASAN